MNSEIKSKTDQEIFKERILIILILYFDEWTTLYSYKNYLHVEDLIKYRRVTYYCC